MRRVLACLVPLLLLAPAARGAGEASLRIDRSRIAVGEAAELSVEIEGRQNVPPAAIPSPAGLRIDYRGQSTEVQIVNGRMSTTARHTYAVQALRPGTYTIGPVRVQDGAGSIDAGSVQLLVVAGAAAAPEGGGEALRLVATVPRHRVYLHEPLPLTVRLEVRGIRVGDLQYPVVESDGLTLAGFPEPVQRRARDAGGGVVDVVEFETEVVPVRSGALTLGPATMRLSVAVGGRGDPFFGSIFDRRRAETVASEPIALEVLPLPEEGRPAGFSGAVGRFALEVSAKPMAVAAGDPVTLTIVVRGTGSLAQAAMPSVPPTPGLKVYDPAEPEAAIRTGPVVSRRFEQVVIPAASGPLVLPPVEFSYFDPVAERYETARGADLLIAVGPGTEQPPEVVIGAAPRETPRGPEALGRDIVFIKDDPGTFVPVGFAWHRTPAFWALQLAPLGLWALVVGWDRRRIRLGADPRLARFARAGAEARRALGAATGRGGADAVARAYADYLSAKLDLPPGAVTADAVRTRLARAGVADAVADGIADLLAVLEHERYRPGETDGVPALRDRALRAVRILERTRRIGISPLVLLVLAATAAAGVPETPKTLFFRGNALYAEGRYADAARTWEQIVAAGVESGALHYNLGNAYLRAGEHGRAVLAYERAWRLIPGDADLAVNLRFAKEDADPTEGMSTWAHVAVPLAPRVATARLAGWAAGAWWLVMGVLVAERLWPGSRRVGRPVAIASAIVLALATSGATYRYLRVDAPAWAVVVGGADVRFEPARTGTVHYEAPAGTVVEIVAARDDWAQVRRRADARRGWIERAAIEPL